MKILIMIVLAISFTACAPKIERVGVFDGFEVYEQPEKVKLDVLLNCEGLYREGGKPIPIGDCVSFKDVEKVIVRVKVLERIIDNYEEDVKSYETIYLEPTKE